MFNKTLKIVPELVNKAKTAVSCDIGEGRWVDMSYRELIEIVEEVHRTLRAIGIKNGDRIMLVGENHFKWLPMFLGITGFGAIAVPIDGNIADQRVFNIVEDCKPSAIIVSKKFQARYEELFRNISIKCNLINFHFDFVVKREDVCAGNHVPKSPEPKDPASIIYTSGTTGNPKGVVLSHGALASAISLGVKLGGFTSGDVMLTILPFTHVFGLVDAGLVPLAAGATIVLASGYNPMDLMQAILRYRVSFILAVPRLADVFAGALKQASISVPQIRMVIGGAACMHETVMELRKHGFKTMLGYGMTETAGGILMCADGPPDSVGKAPEEIRVKLVDVKNGVGELLVDSPTLMSGIYDCENLPISESKPSEQNVALKEVDVESFEDVWLKTGDLAEIDPEGYIYIRGRAKEIIIPPGGINVYPDELEMRIKTLPYAEEYAVFGMQERGIEFPALIFQPKKDYFSSRGIDKPLDYVKEHLAELCRDWPEWERIKRIYISVEALPRSASQKIQRNRLRNLAEHDSAEDIPTGIGISSEIGQFDLQSLFNNAVAKFLQVGSADIKPGKRLNDFLQLDSLGVIALLAHLQNVFKVSLKDAMVSPPETFGDLCKLLEINYRINGQSPENDSKYETPSLPPMLDYSVEALNLRRSFLQNNGRHSVKAIPKPDDPSYFCGNIEGFFGMAQVPLGIAGPLLVKGDYACGEFYLPMATSEGALVSSVSRGCHIITVAGGASVKVLADSVVRAPIFTFEKISDMVSFSEWVRVNFEKIKTMAESTSRYCKLETIEQFHMGSSLCLRLVFSSGDASGQNMSTIAAHEAVKYILSENKNKISDWFLESNLSGDKKINGVNYTRNRGKRVIAEVAIPNKDVQALLHTSPERMVKLSQLSMLSALHSHSFGSQAHYANILAAIFIAAGQDPACVAESAIGVTNLELRRETLLVSITMPGLMVGTVGGGTRLPTQQTCLKILSCDGPRKAKKLAEIVAAAVLAGEISLIGAMAADEFAQAHARYGRAK